MLLTGIVTSPRPTEYLRQTIRAIRGTYPNVKIVVAPCFRDPTQDWAEVFKLIEPEGEILPPLYDTELAAFVAANCEERYKENIYGSEWQHRGLQHNADRLLRELLDRAKGPFVAAQDDFICRPRAFERIQIIARVMGSSALSHVGAVTFYTPYAECGESRKALWRYPMRSFYGDVCVLWRPEVARLFLQHSRPNEAHDLEIQRFFDDILEGKWNLYGHSPCLVQHVGMASARGAHWEGRQNQTMNFDQRDAIECAKPVTGMG